MATPIRTPRLRLDQAPSFELLSTCVHCGLCLEACPTYRELRVEMDSPRGRIYLMKGLLQEKIAPTPEVVRHLDQCLDCRACETACPSGVQYANILESTRAVLQPIERLSWGARLARWFAFARLLPSRRTQRWVFKLLWLQQIVGLTRIGRWLGQRGWLPGRLSAAARQAPIIPRQSFRDRHASAYDPVRQALVFHSRGPLVHRVALFTGCLADQLFAEVNEATIRVLTENGCQVDVIAAESCCGALQIHNGARPQARALARANVRAFATAPYEAIISNAAGCGAELRHYGAFLDGDVEAAAFAAKVRDICEFLCDIGFRHPTQAGRHVGALAYDEPCHLLHAQKISAAPKAILASIPGLTLVSLEDADTCCGSAGAYSLMQPQLSARIGQRKIEAIARSGAELVATGNPGCLMQIRAGVAQAGLGIPVLHPVQLLADAYGS